MKGSTSFGKANTGRNFHSSITLDDSCNLENSLVFGKGYWAKPGEALVTYEGIRRDSVLIPIRKGWNLVGSISGPVSVGDVTTDPESILGAFYEFTGDGYAQADSIRPGRAYWVKAVDAGSLWIGITALKGEVQ